MQVSSHPYLKTYNFPLFSVAALIKIIFIVLAFALPFFATYSTGNFYLSSNLSVNTTQTIAHNSKYFIEIVTSSSTYLHTNLYSQPFTNGIVIEKSQEGSIIDYSVRWSKSDSNQHVRRVEITLFYDYEVRGEKCFGMSTGKVEGYSIAEGTIAGILAIAQGTGSTAYAENSFILNGYSLPKTYQQMTQSSSYLTYKHSSLPINLPSDMLQIRMSVNKGSYLSTSETPSILGQLIWSFMQYFPIFLSLYWILDGVLCFLLREKIVRSDLAHDKEYLGLIEQENQRRERLRLR